MINDCDLVFATWNNMAKAYNLPVVRNCSVKRKTCIEHQISTHGLKNIIEAIHLIPESKFLLGINDRDWKADFDWFINPHKNSITKINEHSYSISSDLTSNEIARSYAQHILADDRLTSKDIRKIGSFLLFKTEKHSENSKEQGLRTVRKGEHETN